MHSVPIPELHLSHFPLSFIFNFDFDPDPGLNLDPSLNLDPGFNLDPGLDFDPDPGLDFDSDFVSRLRLRLRSRRDTSSCLFPLSLPLFYSFFVVPFLL